MEQNYGKNQVRIVTQKADEQNYGKNQVMIVTQKADGAVLRQQ
jgi:hypothetical protein